MLPITHILDSPEGLPRSLRVPIESCCADAATCLKASESQDALHSWWRLPMQPQGSECYDRFNWVIVGLHEFASHGASRSWCFAMLAAFIFPHTVAAYQFYPAGREDSLAVPAGEALRWSPDVWGAGETLVWHIAGNDPDWAVWFGSAEGAAPSVSRALGYWSEIRTADISWRLDGVGDFDEEASRRTGRNFIAIDADAGVAGYAAIWSTRNPSGRWEIHGCSVWLGGRYAQPPPEHENLSFPGLSTLTHELGHCLGLAHTPEFSTTNKLDGFETRSSTRWGPQGLWEAGSPVMSYGYYRTNGSPITLDDETGASLLRPAAGWAANTGSISGRLHVLGEPTAYAFVWAFSNARGPLRDGTGQFSDLDGRFLIEGLPPGEYTLWVSPPRDYCVRVLPEVVQYDLDETVWPHPLRVTAGRVTEGVEITLRRGRQCRPPLPCSPS